MTYPVSILRWGLCRRTVAGVFAGLFFFAVLPSPAQSQINTIGKPMPANAAPSTQQTFRYFMVEPLSYDISIALYEAQGAVPLFERLAMLDENLDLVPGAARSWEVSKDGKKWTFHLRPGAKWSDGRTVTAHDFEYTFKRFLNPAEASPYAFFYYEIKGARAYNHGKTKDPNTVGVRAVDDVTLVVETEAPCAYLPYIMAFSGSGPVPRWQIEKYGRKWSDAGTFVSNSSYTLTEWQKGRQATLSLNRHYKGPHKGFLEKIVQIFTTETVGVAPYENDEVDYLQVQVTDLPFIEKHPKLKNELVRYAFPDTWYLFFQTRKPPFDNLKVRQAISHAIDRETLCRTALRNTGVPAYAMLPAQFPGSSEEQLKTIQRYDPVLAKKRLAEAGYPNGKGFPAIELWMGKASPQLNYVAQAIQGMLLSNLGISVRLRASEDKVYRDNMYQWNIPMGLGGFNADYPDPNNLLAMVWRSQPRGYGRQDWSNPVFDKLVDTAAFEVDSAKRLPLYREAEKTLVEDVGGVFLFHNLTSELRKPYVKGLKVNKYGYSFFTWIGMVHTHLYIGKR
ncbi:MAG: peptide ABC transporter substrate-binding protein [candidate division Zixibacteria bacterium]|nr:peptide ABC transporter substrate-binding protein [candidate division Zixibacteria bacterium]